MNQVIRGSADVPPIVLLMEDDADTRDMYHLVLESDGCRVLDAPDGGHALESALEVQPDVVVTDLGLPGAADGLALVRELREHPTTAKIPVLAVTGRDPGALGDDRQLFSEVLLKPVLPDVLIGRIREAVAHSRQLRERSARARNRHAELLQASRRAMEGSPQPQAMRVSSSLARPCPKCGEMLEWTERRQLYGVTFDYFRPCRSNCGLFCYNHSDRSVVTLAD